MRKVVFCLIIPVVLLGVTSCKSSHKTTMADLGWKMGVQAYTFRDFTFFQAVDKVKQLGLHYIEAYPEQKIGGGMEGTMGYEMNPSYHQKILNHLKDDDVTLIAYGVVTPKTHAQWDSLFTFAKEMGVQNITSEPPQDQMSYVSQLCDKYGINIAIHNHPQPSRYWNPDTLLAAIKGQSSRIGSCADVGHWSRSGLDPVASLKKLAGHVIELHIKDVAAEKIDAPDTVWGTGVSNVKGIVDELYHQHFKGVFSIEYESHPKNNIPEIRKSLAYFDNLVAGLGQNQ